MPYKFQKRVVRGNDSLDVDQMRRDLGDVSEHIATGLGEHAFAERHEDLLIEDETMCALESILSNNPVGFGGTAPHNLPPSVKTGWTAATDEVIIPNSNTWEVIDSVEWENNGPEVLHIFGKQTYGWTGFDPAGSVHHNHAWNQEWDRAASTDQPWETPHVLFALRVNGRILNKTGQRHPHYRARLPIRATTEFQPFPVSSGNNDGEWPGVIGWKTQEVQAPGRLLMAVGFNVVEFTPVGTTKVEIVALRLNKLKQHKFAANDAIAALTRTLTIVRYYADINRTRKTLGVTYTKPVLGDTINSANLFTNGIEPAETRLNSLNENDIGGLNRYHAPSVLVKESGIVQAGSDGVVYSPSITINNWCPGETTSTFAALGTLTGSTGWTPLYASSTEFLVEPDGGGSIPASSRYGKIVLWGSVELESIKKASAAFWENIESIQHMAVVGLYYKQGGTRTLINTSVVPITRVATPKAVDTYDKIASGTIEDNCKPPLHAEIDLTSSLLGADIDGFGICVSAVNCNSTNRVEIEVARANLTFEFYRK